MTTIRDVARQSGYSVSTVSRVLNNKPYVKQSVRQAILQVVSQLDYVPNSVARDLSFGHTKSVGVVIPALRHPFYTQLVNGIIRAAVTQDYTVTMLPSRYDPKTEQDYLEQLRRKSYDALIFTSHSLTLPKLRSYLKYGPIVICHDPGQDPIPAAYTNRNASYLEAWAWIQKTGVKHIGLLLPRDPTLSATASELVTTYRAVFGEDPDPDLVWANSQSYEDGYAAGAYFAQRPTDFIFANGDDIAVGIAQYYQDHNLTCPKLMGQENQLSGRLLHMPTIVHHYDQVGEAALNIAIGASAELRIEIPSEFIPRN